jgi:hypothetical protein
MPGMSRVLSATLLLTATLTSAACTTGDDGAALAAAATTAAPATPATTVVAAGDTEDLDAFCAGFAELAEARVPGDPSRLDLGDGSAEDAAAAYAAQRATVEEIAAAAPEEMRDNAETYVEVIDARAAAAAASPGEDMTSEERAAFAEGRMAQQQEINDLLAYARTTCPGFT